MSGLLTLDRIAGAPISWGLCEVPGWGYQLTPERVLSEMRDLGLGATEFGPPGFLAVDPHERVAQLSRYDMSSVGGFYVALLHDPNHDPLPGIDTFIDECLAANAGTVVVPPDSKASMLVREVVSSAIGRIEADRVLEERVTVDVVDLIYRPVYAFRYRHGGKEAVMEFDGLTGDIRPDGATFEQYLGKILEPRFLLDVGVEAVNIFVPGTQLVRILAEQGAKRLAQRDHGA